MIYTKENEYGYGKNAGHLSYVMIYKLQMRSISKIHTFSYSLTHSLTLSLSRHRDSYVASSNSILRAHVNSVLILLLK